MVHKLCSRVNNFLLRVYRKSLKIISFSSKASKLILSKPTAAFTYVTLCGEHHADMLNESLYSVVRNWESIPSFLIYSDGSMSCQQIEQKYKWLGNRLTVLPWQNSLTSFDPEKEHVVHAYAHKHVMGKKFAVIVSGGRRGPAFWCDSDVLWFKNLKIKSSHKPFEIISSADYQPSYSANLLEIYPRLLKEPYVCAGILYIKGDMITHTKLETMLLMALSNPDHFSEQTMIARSVIDNGANIGDTNVIACF